nr:hypothetical protein [Tanacetum cinerariifolium]
MDKVRCDKRKDVHARLDFGEGSRERRTREDSHHSSARARTTKPERLKVRDRLRYGDRRHRRQSAFDRLSETYSPSTTKSRPGKTNSRDHPRGRSHPRRLDTSNEDCPEDRERFRCVGESYDDSYSHYHHDRNRSRHMMRRRDNESPLSSVSKSDSSDGRYRKSRSKRHKPTDDDDLTRPWMCEEKDPFTPRIRNFESSRRTRMPNNVKTYDGTGDPEDHVKIFQVATQIEELVRPSKLSHLIKEIKHGRDQSKAGKKEIPAKDKSAAIYMIQSWQRMTRQKMTQSFKRVREITFPPLTTSSGEEGPLSKPKTPVDLVRQTRDLLIFFDSSSSSSSSKQIDEKFATLSKLLRELKQILYGNSEAEPVAEACAQLTQEFFKHNTLRLFIVCLPKLNLEELLKKMSAMANTTPIVTIVTKTATKEKTSNGAEAASRVNILDFCEEHYEDILPVMDKIRRNKQKEVHTRLDFGENSRKSQMREDSQNSSVKTLSARYRNPSERP